MPSIQSIRSLSLLILLAVPHAVLAQEAAAQGAEGAEGAVLPSTREEAVPSGAAPAETALPGGDTPGKAVLVVLKDGQELRGRLLRQDASGLHLELAGGSVLSLSSASVRSVTDQTHVPVSETGERFGADPNRTRYFYSPTAMMLRPGEVYFSQKELLFSALAVGVTENLSVLVGSIVPAWFGGTSGMNFIFGAKAGLPVATNVHLAVGAESLLLPGFGTSTGNATLVGLAFGTVTVGGPDAHVSLSVGKPFDLSASVGVPDDLLVMTLSGNLRVGRNSALVTEHWVIPSLTSGYVATAHGLGVRFIFERIAVDLGGVFLGNWGPDRSGLAVPYPVPWLDFTYNFG
ncbi:MAG: hypothetical protein L0Y66_26685 [Myxococcaceae bacterium]|nr:hypothetical protein [Myxococcaceae bacterium]MCI0670997.1 hypothetical protein [Myxococcaceae bacterium]